MVTDPDLSVLSDFELVWRAYPRKVGKKAARKVWDKLKPSTALVQKMLDTLVWQVRQPSWTKDGGQFVPHLATWLNQERWDDEPPASLGESRNDRLQGLRDFVDGDHVH